MLTGLWGKKIGMTQLFSDKNKVVPVTAIDISNWRVTNIKTADRDGYKAVQLGFVREKYKNQEMTAEWVKNAKEYFQALREVPVSADVDLTMGQGVDVAELLKNGDNVDVVGLSIGRGFQGAVKRHGFRGGRASHGDKLGRKPGSLSFMRRQGRVMKGKKLPGHMGVERCTTKNIEVVRLDSSAHVIFLKGSVPGKTGSLVFMRKCE